MCSFLSKIDVCHIDEAAKKFTYKNTFLHNSIRINKDQPHEFEWAFIHYACSLSSFFHLKGFAHSLGGKISGKLAGTIGTLSINSLRSKFMIFKWKMACVLFTSVLLKIQSPSNCFLNVNHHSADEIALIMTETLKFHSFQRYYFASLGEFHFWRRSEPGNDDACSIHSFIMLHAFISLWKMKQTV